jgi:uncharacterized membrane protein
VLALIKHIFKAISGFYSRLNIRLDKRSWIFIGIAAVIVIAAGFIRIWASPISAGPDISQFWGFAKLFQIHGLDFYRYADGSDPILPNSGWGYVYPPLWLLILRIALIASPSSMATGDMVDTSWRVAMKTPIIAADLAIGALLIWAIPGSKLKKLFFGFIWLFHPTAWYNSAVFGQFDAIAAVLLLVSLIMLLRGRDRLGFVFAGLAIITKQHTAIPVILMIAALARKMDKRRLLTNCAIIAGIFLVTSIPFIFDGNLGPYLRSVLFPAQSPTYQLPLVYAFGGIGSLLTYVHETLGWQTEPFIVYCIPVLVAAIVAAAVFCYFKPVRLEQAALAGILLFIAIFYRINYQYLVIYLPIAIMALAIARRWVERGLLLALIILPASWVWLFDVTFWFRYLRPYTTSDLSILNHIGLDHYIVDPVYVTIAGSLMVLALTYSITIFIQKSRQQNLQGY